MAPPIRYRRGLIQILDRAALEDISCECHAAVRHNAGKVFPQPRLRDKALGPLSEERP
jgi:hypothetical protein